MTYTYRTKHIRGKNAMIENKTITIVKSIQKNFKLHASPDMHALVYFPCFAF